MSRVEALAPLELSIGRGRGRPRAPWQRERSLHASMRIHIPENRMGVHRGQRALIPALIVAGFREDRPALAWLVCKRLRIATSHEGSESSRVEG